jgi:hypothetical protein
MKLSADSESREVNEAHGRPPASALRGRHAAQGIAEGQ